MAGEDPWTIIQADKQEVTGMLLKAGADINEQYN